MKAVEQPRQVRILILSTYYHPVVGGSETNARQLATYLQQRGFVVTVLTKRVGRDVPNRETLDGVTIIRVRPGGSRSQWQKWLMLPSVFFTMLRLGHQFDLVFSPDYRGIGIAGILAALVLGRPSAMGTQALGVINAHNLDPILARLHVRTSSGIARIIRWPFQAIYTRADAYPAITRAIEREAIAAGVPPERVHFLPNSVDIQRFRQPLPGEREEIRRRLGWQTDKTICLYLARLSREKGLMDLMAAWREVTAGHAMLYVGGPDMEGHSFNVGPAARAFVVEHGLQDRVRFLGPTSEPYTLLRAADLLVQPSHWEAAPFGVLEAMATGLPVVATRVGGMAEYLTHEETALLCEPHDPTGLACQLTRMIGDEAMRARLAEAGRAIVLRDFDQAVICDRYATLFTALATRADRA
ncbi:MAG: glycosyltransferase family 4 protein [Vicinamibacterales bacterium]